MCCAAYYREPNPLALGERGRRAEPGKGVPTPGPVPAFCSGGTCWAGLGLGPLNPTPASPRSRAPTESAARALLIHSHSQPKLIKGTHEPQGSCSAAESPSRGELGEGVTRAQMPTNYSVALSRALPGMPDSGRTSLSLSTNVGEPPKSGMTQPAPPRTQAATPPCSISPRRKKTEPNTRN